MKAVYGKDDPSYDVVKHWHCQFRCGRIPMETVPVHRRPQSSIDNAITILQAPDGTRRLVLPRIPQGSLGEIGPNPKSIEKRKRKTTLSLHDLSHRLQEIRHQVHETKQKKETKAKPVKLSTLETRGSGINDLTNEIKLPTLHTCKLPAINTYPSLKHHMTTSRLLTTAEDSTLDDSSFHSMCKTTTQVHTKLQRSRESAYTSRDYLISLMPPKNAKRYKFSEGVIHGAQQELLRMKKLIGRDNHSADKSHTGPVFLESRRRASSINTLMSGNPENTTNNSTPPDTEPSAIDRITAFNTSRNKVFPGEKKDPDQMLKSILTICSNLTKRNGQLKPGQRIFKQSENIKSMGNLLNFTHSNKKWDRTIYFQIFKMEPGKRRDITGLNKTACEQTENNIMKRTG